MRVRFGFVFTLYCTFLTPFRRFASLISIFRNQDPFDLVPHDDADVADTGVSIRDLLEIIWPGGGGLSPMDEFYLFFSRPKGYWMVTDLALGSAKWPKRVGQKIGWIWVEKSFAIFSFPQSFRMNLKLKVKWVPAIPWMVCKGTQAPFFFPSNFLQILQNFAKMALIWGKGVCFCMVFGFFWGFCWEMILT